MKIGYLRRKGRGSKIVKDNVPIILDAPFKFFISKKLSAFFYRNMDICLNYLQ